MSCPTRLKRPVFIGEPYFSLALQRLPFAPWEADSLSGAAAKFDSKKATSLPRRSRLAAVLALAAPLGCGLAWSAPSPQLVGQSEDQIAACRNVQSYVDQSTVELVSTIPDLKGLQPVETRKQGEEALKGILDRVGENVRQFYAEFPDITSLERITLERFGPDGRVESTRNETFRYLAVASAGRGALTLVEYRTDMAGKPVQPTGLAQGFVITKGFASLSIYLHPEFRSESYFRYLGKQKMDGKNTDVVAFAQRPGWVAAPMRVTIQGQTADALVQGLAWIDSASDQIVRMRVALLAPRPDVGLMRESTEITFREVRFPQIPGTVLWLPRKVAVNIEWKGEVHTEATMHLAGTSFQTKVTKARLEHLTYRNVHRYSGYKLFAAESKIKY